MLLPHVMPIDRPLAREFGRIADLIERCDRDIDDRGLLNSEGHVRSIVDLRLPFADLRPA